MACNMIKMAQSNQINDEEVYFKAGMWRTTNDDYPTKIMETKASYHFHKCINSVQKLNTHTTHQVILLL